MPLVVGQRYDTRLSHQEAIGRLIELQALDWIVYAPRRIQQVLILLIVPMNGLPIQADAQKIVGVRIVGHPPKAKQLRRMRRQSPKIIAGLEHLPRYCEAQILPPLGL